MDGHERVLRMTDEDFESSVKLLEEAFVALCASFYFDGESGNAIEVFDFFDGADEIPVWLDLREFASDVQAMVFFAFEGAPTDVVERWANEHLSGSGEMAVSRVAFLEATLQTAAAEWRRRFTFLAPTFGDMKTTHVYDEDANEYRTIIRLDSFYTEGLRKLPTMSTRQYVSAALSRAELRRLIDRLRIADYKYDLGNSDLDDPENEDISDGHDAEESPE